MSNTPFAFTPAQGLRDSTAYPTNPGSEAAARDNVQKGMDQIRDYLNSLTPKLWGDDTYTSRPYTKASVGGTPTFTAGVFTKVPFSSEITDYTASYDPASFRFTAPIAGVCIVSCLILGLSVPANTLIELTLYRNGAAYERIDCKTSPASTSTFGIGGTVQLPLSAGDYIELFLAPTTNNVNLSGGDCKLNIRMI